MTNKAYNFVINGVTHTVLDFDKALLFKLQHGKEISKSFESVIEDDNFDPDDHQIYVDEYSHKEVKLMTEGGVEYYLDPVFDENCNFLYFEYNEYKIKFEDLSENLRGQMSVTIMEHQAIDYINDLIENDYDEVAEMRHKEMYYEKKRYENE